MGNALVNYVWTNYYLNKNHKEHDCSVVSVVNEHFFCEKSTDNLGNFTKYGKSNLKLLDFSFKVRLPTYYLVLCIFFLGFSFNNFPFIL